MDDKNRIEEALAHDLRNEYGLAFRYLIIADELRRRKSGEIAQIIMDLATDSVSHSILVKSMLKTLNYPYSDSVTPFSTDFSSLETVLRGSYLIEKKMHLEYKRLAEDLGEEHPFKPLLWSLSLWERRHMASVAKALDELGDVGKEPSVHIVAEQLLKGREEALQEAESWPAEDLFKYLGGAIRDTPPEEHIVFSSLVTGRPDTLEPSKKEELAMLDMSRVGQRAEDIVDAEALEIIWGDGDYEGYCLKCGATVGIGAPERIVLANMNTAVRGKCGQCKATVFSMA